MYSVWSDKYVEKNLLYLLLLSLLLHVGAFLMLQYLPKEKQLSPKEPVFIDLQPLPGIKPPQEKTPSAVKPRLSDRRMRVERETAPRVAPQDRVLPSPAARERTASPAQRRSEAKPGPQARQRDGEMREPVAPGSSASSLLKPQQQERPAGRPQLFPAGRSLARIEESYRRRFEKDLAEGSTSFLNTEDMLFGSFLRRFENLVYGVWRYPAAAARNGIEGITPVKITFNRSGEVVRVQLLESSGAAILDEEVLRTLKMVGPVGSFPRGYTKDEFHLIAFFQYGTTRRLLR